MLNHQTVEKLTAMKLTAMAEEYRRQLEAPAMDALSIEERIAMMVDAEWLARDNKRVNRLIKKANLSNSGALFADIDYRPQRKLDRAYIARLSDFAWTRDAKNIIFTGPTGTGKTWLACAFGHEACRKGLRVAFYRVNRLLGEMIRTDANDSLFKLLAKLRKADILILDDWGLTTLTPIESRYLLEIFEDRYSRLSTIFSAQLPVSKWHALFEDPTVADAVLDRIVHNSHRIELAGASLRASPDKVKTLTAPCSAQGQKTYVINIDENTQALSEGGEGQ
jgi:DNA replication protein DnaC